MYDEHKINLSKNRIKEAKTLLSTAKALIDIGDYKSSANRSYYSVFHCMRSVLALDGFDSKKHSGIISEFRKSYIKTSVFSIELSNIIDILFEIRNSSDYDDFYVISKQAVEEQLANANVFYINISDYL